MKTRSLGCEIEIQCLTLSKYLSQSTNTSNIAANYVHMCSTCSAPTNNLEGAFLARYLPICLRYLFLSWPGLCRASLCQNICLSPPIPQTLSQSVGVCVLQEMCHQLLLMISTLFILELAWTVPWFILSI